MSTTDSTPQSSPEGTGSQAPPQEPYIPPTQWVPIDPEAADVGYWGDFEGPGYVDANDKEAVARIEENQRKLLGGRLPNEPPGDQPKGAN